jgi:hypothetical protein
MEAVSARPGQNNIQGALTIKTRPGPDIIAPQLAMGGGKPSPRKLKLASAIITAPMRRVKVVIMNGKIFGSMCRIIIVQVLAPIVADA